MFEVHVAARQNTTGDSAWWKISGGIKRDALANTTLIGTNTVSTQADLGASTWVVQVLADDVNEALEVLVTGESNKTIRWVATVHLTRVAG